MQINAGSINYGGVSSMIFEIYKNIDRSRFDFYFVSPMKTTYEIKRTEIENMGGKIIELDTNGNAIKRKIQLFFRLKTLLKKEKMDIVHINSGNFLFNLEVAIIARLLKVKKIIVHSHNGKNPNIKIKNFFTKLLKPFLNFFATDFLTCSSEAAMAMYTDSMINNKVVMIPNGVETEKFKFNDEIRNNYRNELNISDKVVIGNIGRFLEQKNHLFLIDVFNEYLKINDNAVLLLIGEGELKENVEGYVKKLNISDKVNFLGLRNDIPNLLMCIDVFIMTSLHEGLPVVGVEAQASGLKLILSDTITKQVKVTSNVEFISLDKSPYEWALAIKENLKNKNDRNNVYKIVQESGFDIKQTVRKIEEIYLK